MAKEKMTVVKKGGRMSVHGSFKTACIAYGWDYEGFGKRFQSDIDGHKLTKIPVGVTINCFLMLDHCAKYRKIQSFEETKDGTCMVDFSGPDRTFFVEVNTITKSEESNIIDGQEESPAHEWEEAENVCRVFQVTDDDKIIDINIDPWTEQELLNLIDLSE